MTDIYVAPFNPDILLVDTGVIARAPLRLFIAGMGDGIVTHLEGRMAYASRCTAVNRASAVPTIATRTIAEACYRILLEDGQEAVEQVKLHVVTPLLERVVEAMVLHSGLGGESGGIAAAHSIANNLPFFRQNREFYHGENVAFGLMVQFMLDDAIPLKEAKRITEWMIGVGLPVTVGGVGLGGVPREELRAFSEVCLKSPTSFFQSMIAPPNVQKLTDALVAADSFGDRCRRELGLNAE